MFEPFQRRDIWPAACLVLQVMHVFFGEQVQASIFAAAILVIAALRTD